MLPRRCLKRVAQARWPVRGFEPQGPSPAPSVTIQDHDPPGRTSPARTRKAGRSGTLSVDVHPRIVRRSPSPPAPARAGTARRSPWSCRARRSGCRTRTRRTTLRRVRRPAPWWPMRSAPGAACPRSPAKPQQPQVSGTVTDSATASATPRRESFIPIRVDEQVGCSAIAGPSGSPPVAAAPALRRTRPRRRSAAPRTAVGGGDLALQHLPQPLGAGRRVTDDRQFTLPAGRPQRGQHPAGHLGVAGLHSLGRQGVPQHRSGRSAG